MTGSKNDFSALYEAQINTSAFWIKLIKNFLQIQRSGWQLCYVMTLNMYFWVTYNVLFLI